MVSRGHRLQDLLILYPISTLIAMIESARHNQREEQMMQTQGVTCAVMHGLDGAFNKGKGKVLKKYQDSLFPRKERSIGIGDAAQKLLNFFAPRVKK